MNVFCKISVDLFFFTTHNYYSCAVPFVFHIFFIIQIQLNNVETMQGLYLSFICFFFFCVHDLCIGYEMCGSYCEVSWLRVCQSYYLFIRQGYRYFLSCLFTLYLSLTLPHRNNAVLYCKTYLVRFNSSRTYLPTYLRISIRHFAADESGVCRLCVEHKTITQYSHYSGIL